MFEKEKKSGPNVFTYDIEKLQAAIAECLQRRLSVEVWNWLEEKAALSMKNENVQHFILAFSMMPRKTGKQILFISEVEESTFQNIRKGLVVKHWTVDRLARVWMVLHLDTSYREHYIDTIENLFLTAEMSEQVALYSALPMFAYPEAWRGRCAEGIRSNIADVLDSIMCYNPYPAENLDEPAWNQLVLKAIFTEKPIHRITGLDARANQILANALSDYAHERWAAHRAVLPMLWRCVGRFINEHIFPDIQRIASSEQTLERQAAALACAQSNYKAATELLENNTTLQAIIKSGMTWDDFANELEENF